VYYSVLQCCSAQQRKCAYGVRLLQLQCVAVCGSKNVCI